MTIGIGQIVKSGLCTGCGLCESVTAGRLVMELDQEGFYSPRPAEGADAAEPGVPRQVTEVCPGLHGAVGDGLPAAAGVWGSWERMDIGHASDAALRFRGSSGGALSALLSDLLSSGAVDRVAHIGPAATDPLLSTARISANSEDILRSTGSRYGPASPLAQVDRWLERDGWFAFVGRPCDVCALRRYAARNPRLAEKVRCTIAFLCAGTPSRHATGALLAALGVEEGEVTRLRYRGEGWPGALTVETAQRGTRRMSYEEAWGSYLGRQVRFRCKVCFDSIGEAADVVFGDAWHCGEDGRPDFTERDGRSLIIARTPGGRALLEAAIERGSIVLDCDQVSEEELSRMQPYHVSRRASLFARLLALRMFGRPVPSYPRRALLGAARRNRLQVSIHQFLGSARRALRPNALMRS